MVDDPALQREAARVWVAHKCPDRNRIIPEVQSVPNDRVRIGYYSADLQEHATSYLMAELFEQMGRRGVATVAVAEGVPTLAGLRQNVEVGVRYLAAWLAGLGS